MIDSHGEQVCEQNFHVFKKRVLSMLINEFFHCSSTLLFRMKDAFDLPRGSSMDEQINRNGIRQRRVGKHAHQQNLEQRFQVSKQLLSAYDLLACLRDTEGVIETSERCRNAGLPEDLGPHESSQDSFLSKTEPKSRFE